ncbi:DUF4173 domain-containing protein [Lentzea sp. NBRC 105346]|uniref:DUF4153 domain-containing protein n=1 Tax=Lentzea sp. NBRC 105346 TaxID=3032205 RepID=UPI002553D433|nr:DUF4173 domain-containing protein [Lentzea sp. NBRC 105346]
MSDEKPDATAAKLADEWAGPKPAQRVQTVPVYPAAGPVLLQPPAPMFPWWKPPAESAPIGVLWTGAAAGLGAAALTPWVIGVGWFLGGLVGTIALVVHIGRPTPRQSLWLAAALALLGIGALRDADWLFPLCVMASILCGSLAVTSGRSVLHLGFSAIAVPLAALRSIPWVARGIGKARPRNARILVSLAVSVVLLLIFGSLLTSADAAFDRLVQRMVPDLDEATVSWWIFLFGAAGFGAFGACYLLAAPAHIKANDDRGPGRLRPEDYALPVGALVVLFAVFICTQLAVIFGGDAYVQAPGTVTYSEYARSGFWQLLWVTVLTLAVIGFVARFARKDEARERTWLRGLLGALAVLTLVIVASAISRMWFYQQAYGFTVLRLVVEAFELWLGLVYLLVIFAGIRMEAKWLPNTIVATGVAFFLSLAVLNPEGIVASHNVTRWQETGKIDPYYLSELSADALPAIYQLPEPLRSCAIWPARFAPDGPEDFRHWNLSRSTGRALLAAQPPTNSCENVRPYR